jgi:hypothetical protein
MECWVDLNPGPAKPSPGFPLPLTEHLDRGRPTRLWAVGPYRQRLYKGARELRFIDCSKTLHLDRYQSLDALDSDGKPPLQCFIAADGLTSSTARPWRLLRRLRPRV